MKVLWFLEFTNVFFQIMLSNNFVVFAVAFHMLHLAWGILICVLQTTILSVLAFLYWRWRSGIENTAGGNLHDHAQYDEELERDDGEDLDFNELSIDDWSRRVQTPKPKPLNRLKTFVTSKLAILLLFLAFTNTGVIIFNLVFYGTCLCINPISFTTSFTRISDKTVICGAGICVVTVNLPEKADTSMIVKFFSKTSPQRAYITINDVEQDCSSINMNTYQWEPQDRWVHTCDLTGLTPGSSNTFRVSLQGTDGLLYDDDQRKFRTLNYNDTEILFAAGGDMGYTEASIEITKRAAETNPAFIVVGGDLAYDNGFLPCFSRWYSYLSAYQNNAVTSDGHMIPLLSGIGNHEAIHGKFYKKKNEALPYLHYVSHQIGVPPLEQSTYRVHLLNKACSITVLDSAVTVPHEDQVSFMEQQWQRDDIAGTIKLVIYHAPLYPTSRKEDHFLVVEGRRTWAPLFSQYNVSVAFENHDHTFKRTKVMSNNAVVGNDTNSLLGTVFVGDGAMGVMRNAQMKSNMEKVDSMYHFYSVRCNEQGVSVKAINEDGRIFDEFSRLNPN